MQQRTMVSTNQMANVTVKIQSTVSIFEKSITEKMQIAAIAVSYTHLTLPTN